MHYLAECTSKIINIVRGIWLVNVTANDIIFVAISVGVAALVVSLTTLEGREAILEEAGYQPLAKQKQQNETSQSSVPNIQQYNPS